MSVFVWTMAGLAIWHFAIFVPDRFVGGIAGAFLTAWLGALASGFAIEGLRLPDDNPPGIIHVLYALPGSVLALVGSWWAGNRHMAAP
jgi:hypothetical protein